MRTVFLIVCGLTGFSFMEIGAQTVQGRHRVNLVLGTDSLTIEERVREPTITRSEDGHWFVAGLQLGWKWAEFDSSGVLVRAPGARGRGPGEFTEILRIIPLRGDSLLVVERNRIVRVLRDGSYIDEEIIPFRVGSHSFHSGLHWIASKPARAFYLWALSPSGKIVRRHELPPSPSAAGGGYSSKVVSWGDELWVWAYPRGPLLRISPASGQIVDRWQPFEREGHQEWRIDMVAEGPRGTLLLNYVDVSTGEASQQWVLIDRQRSITRTSRPASLRFSQLLSPGMAWTGVFSNPPLEILEGMAIYEITMTAR